MKKDTQIVWIDGQGDVRKKNKATSESDIYVNENTLCLELRRLKSGKGREMVEIKALPSNKAWCKKMTKEIKKSLGVGGAYKNDFIEIHTSEFLRVSDFLDEKGIRWKKTGG